MRSIDDRTMHAAAPYVAECTSHADIHTVTVTLNGQHGGADVKIEGTTPSDEDYERTFRVSEGRF